MKAGIIKTILFTNIIYCFCISNANAQLYKEVYPIAEDPDIQYKFVQIDPGQILFEANPIVRYSFFNNFQQRLMNQDTSAMAIYLDYRPQLRMFTVNSKPVRTPSSRIAISYQQLRRLRNDRHQVRSLLWMYQTGHYSNGQQNCAFDENAEDGSAACMAAYQAITDDTDLSAILNRKSGNFSTNYTRVFVAFRSDLLRSGHNAISHQVTIGSTIYHDRLLYLFDVGGYSDEDIKIYGRTKMHLWYEYQRVFQGFTYKRVSGQFRVERIFTPHKSVEPWRLELRVNGYFFENIPDFGFFLEGDIGHDNYNYRFVDSGFTLSAGITWDAFGVLLW